MTTVDHPSFCGVRATSTDVSERAPEFAVLPVGAHEQHGAHLPLNTDTMVASWAGEQVARRLGGLLLPTIPYGTSFTHRTFAGTVTLEYTTLAALVGDVVGNCYAHGVMTVFIMSGHGGNFILNPCVRSINARHPQGQTVLVPEGVFFGESMTADDFHAGRWETSLALALASDDVRMERAVDFVPSGINRAELTNRPISEFTAHRGLGPRHRGHRRGGRAAPAGHVGSAERLRVRMAGSTGSPRSAPRMTLPRPAE